MATDRRKRNQELTGDQHLHSHDDDLDDGAMAMSSFRKELRANTVMVFTVLVVVIGGLVGSLT